MELRVQVQFSKNKGFSKLLATKVYYYELRGKYLLGWCGIERENIMKFSWIKVSY